MCGVQVFGGASWAPLAPLPTPRFGGCGLGHPGGPGDLGFLLVAGGWGAADHPQVQATVEVYHVARDRWKVLGLTGNPWAGMMGGSCAPGRRAGDSSSMVVLGGTTYPNTREPTISMARLEFGEELGTTLHQGVAVSHQPAVGWVADRLVVAGGRGEANTSTRVLELRGEEWEEVGRLARPREQAPAVVLPGVWTAAAKCSAPEERGTNIEEEAGGAEVEEGTAPEEALQAQDSQAATPGARSGAGEETARNVFIID